MIPGEIFPTRYRSTAHGISAASGKLGAIVAQLVAFKLKDRGGKNNWIKCVRLFREIEGFGMADFGSSQPHPRDLRPVHAYWSRFDASHSRGTFDILFAGVPSTDPRIAFRRPRANHSKSCLARIRRTSFSSGALPRLRRSKSGDEVDRLGACLQLGFFFTNLS